MVLGEIFGKQDEVQKLVDDFDVVVECVKVVYDDVDIVMVVNMFGGEIGYFVLIVGCLFGLIYDIFGFIFVFEVDDVSDDYQGDEIFVEVIVFLNFDWIFVFDCDVVFVVEILDYVQVVEIFESFEVLVGVIVVKEKQIVYMFIDIYLNEGIQIYMMFLNDFVDVFEQSVKN